VLAFCIVPQTRADLLTDKQLYFDPDSIESDLYPRLTLESTGALSLSSPMPRTIVGVNILPPLRHASYPPGYSFSQSDYEFQPNVHYQADLTDGTLTATFNEAGLFSLRVYYDDSSTQTYTTFVDTHLEERGPNRVGATVQIGGAPRGNKPPDLFIIANDPDGPRRFSGLRAAGIPLDDIRFAHTPQTAAGLVSVRSMALNRRINVVFLGHGLAGGFWFGDENYISNQNYGPNGITPADFGALLAPWTKGAHFWSCSVAAGAVGETFLQEMANQEMSFDVSGWTGSVYSPRNGRFGTDRDAGYLKVPEPVTLMLLLAALSARSRLRLRRS